MLLLWFAYLFFQLLAGNSFDSKAWLQEVNYIISRQEKEAYLALGSDVDRRLFVEEFWIRRDVDPSTEQNEFREVYLDRVRVAHERFRPLSDRARVFVLNGEPDQRLVYPEMKFEEVLPGASSEQSLGGSGGLANEGTQLRGADASFPTVYIESPAAEIWTYYHSSGSSSISGPLELIFMRVPPGELSTLYAVPHLLDRLALARMLMNTPLFRGSRTFVADFTIVYAGQPRFHGVRDFYHQMLNQNRTFDTLEIMRSITEVRRSTGDLKEAERRRVLQEVVASNIFFDSFEASVDYWFFRAVGDFVYVPVALFVPGQELSGVSELSILAEIDDGERTVAHFVDDVTFEKGEEKSLRRDGFLYQSRFAVKPGLYTINAYLLDRQNGRQHHVEQAISVPDLRETGFSLSNLVLCNEVLDEEEARNESEGHFEREWLTFSDLNPLAADGYLLKPAPSQKFRRKDLMTVFFEVYLPELEDNRPNVEVDFTVLRGGSEVARIEVDQLRYLTEDRMAKITFAQSLSLSGLKPGFYSIRVRARDLVSGNQAVETNQFEVL